MSKITIYCDGSVSKPRFGRAISGWVVDDENGKELWTGASIVADGTDRATVNVAEYNAVLLGLESVYASVLFGELDLKLIEVKSDSLLIINQLLGTWACNDEHLRVIRDQVRKTVSVFNDSVVTVTYCWIPREQNQRADAKSKELHWPLLKCMEKKKRKAVNP